MRITITHPMADTVSVIYDYVGGEETREIAFFRKGKWVNAPIPEFARYYEGLDGFDTSVYRGVPKRLVDAFIKIWSDDK